MTLKHDELKERSRARRMAANEACRPGNPANKAWSERWEREFSCRWVQRGNKFYPADSKVKP